MAPDVHDTTPDKVDMREALWPVEDLGDILGASASAALVALEYHCNRMGVPPTNLSTMFVHYNARLLSGKENENVGTSLDAAMKAITTYGACPEASWPFDPAKFAVKPPAHVYEEAKRFAAVRTAHPASTIQALSAKYPVPFVATLPLRYLGLAGRSGTMPTPTEDEMRGEGLTYHPLVVVGYDKTAKTFLVRNCWGKEWGTEGHCTISFDVMDMICKGPGRRWFISKPETTVAPQDSDFIPAAASERLSAAEITPSADPPGPAARPERLSNLAARLRDEMRGDLQRDLADASRRVRDMLSQPPGGRDRTRGQG